MFTVLRSMRASRLLTSIDVSNFDTSKVTYMAYMFHNCSSLTSIDVSKWDVGNVTSMVYMFNNCKVLSLLNVNNWDVSKVTDMSHMFNGCQSLTSLDVSNWDTGNVTNMTNTFCLCKSLTSLDVSKWNTSKVTTLFCLFNGCQSLTSLDVSNWDTSNVTNMGYIFTNCKNVTTLGDLSNWDTRKATSMHSMFYYCHKLTSVNVSNFNTSNVTTMYAMFCACYELTEIDVSNFDTSKVLNTQSMFSMCHKLSTLSPGKFDLGKVELLSRMFKDLLALKILDLTHVEFIANDYEEIIVNSNALEVFKCDKISTLHKLIPLLPDRNGRDKGKVIVNEVQDRMDEYCLSLLAERNWEVTSELGLLVADYIFDPEICVSNLPICNEGYLDDCIIVDEYIVDYVPEEANEIDEMDENEGIMTLDETRNGKLVIRRKLYNIKEESPSSIMFGMDYIDNSFMGIARN